MEILLILLQFLGELLLQIFGEALIQLVFRSAAWVLGFSQPEEGSDKFLQPHPAVAVGGYVLLGGLVGGLSLMVFPGAFIQAPALRGINLFFTPILVGLLMVGRGKRNLRSTQNHRPRTGKRRSAHSSQAEVFQFSCGFAFAFAVALVRSIWAH